MGWAFPRGLCRYTTGVIEKLCQLEQPLCSIPNRWPRLTVRTLPSVQSIPDKQLAALGAKRRSCVCMSYFGAALSCLPGTDLVLTLTNGMRQMVERNSTLRLVKAPQELRPFHFLMVWHPRLTTDVRHTWLREAVRQVSPQEASGRFE